ncbi:thioesterase [Zafaria cholistanensis]|uniref:Thioesterase n=1 Tax=Zafaria cholistanensis TaxID=1682741 RepID=A0A5A7NMU3_9MICC|nr:thioesterase family protein [Zafaria cholistanensis]GER22225.1 thioesterase [Zafaria cholistanensis]
MTTTVQQGQEPPFARTEAYYQGLGGSRYHSSAHTQGAWNPAEQHMAAATGLLTHELELFQPRPEMRMARISLDILGVIHAGELEVRTRMVRPGRTIELIEAEMVCQGRSAVLARAWRLKTLDSAPVAAVEDRSVTHPEDLPEWEGMSSWPGGFIRSLDFRVEPGHRPGRGVVWLRSPREMVDGLPTSDLVRLMGLVDTANGVAPRMGPGPVSWMFPNVDLQIHMHRAPVGEWLGLAARQTYGTDGIGLTSAVLHDVEGPFGRSEQILTVRPMPERGA